MPAHPDAVSPSPPRRPPAAWPALAGLLAAVALLHLALVGWLLPERPGRAGRAVPGVLRVLAVAPPAATAPAPVVPPPAAALAAAAAAPAPAPAQAPGLPVPATPATPAPAEPAPTPALAPQPIDEPVPALSDADADAAAGDAAAPPPLYPTRLPPPARLAYQLRYNGRTGQATLLWRPVAGSGYQLGLTGLAADGSRLVEQLSQGLLDEQGVAPEQFIDRRRGGRGWQAAHLRRDVGRISYSGPQRSHALWPGTQDRLSWIAQLAGILAAAPAVPAEVLLLVADARGHADLWRLQAQDTDALDTPLGRLQTQRWVREPLRPAGLRVEAWTDAQRQHWPVLLRFTALRSGDVFELQLATEPALP